MAGVLKNPPTTVHQVRKVARHRPYKRSLLSYNLKCQGACPQKNTETTNKHT